MERSIKPITHWCYPTNSKCPICKKSLLGNFIVLNFGSMLMNTKTNSSTTPKGKHLQEEGFMYLMSHFDSKNEYNHVNIADNVIGGQVDIYTCSKKCMKKLFNKFIDQLK